MGVCLIGVEGTVLVSVIIAFVQIAMMRHGESRDCGSNCAGTVWLLGGALRNTGSEVRRHQQPTKTFLAGLDRAKQQTPGGLGKCSPILYPGPVPKPFHALGSGRVSPCLVRPLIT